MRGHCEPHFGDGSFLTAAAAFPTRSVGRSQSPAGDPHLLVPFSVGPVSRSTD